ncbi:MAG: hypothetical protein V8T49_02160, partial [Paraprevotella clara]
IVIPLWIIRSWPFIGGDSTDYAFYIDRTSTSPELFVPGEGETVDFGLQALSKGLEGRLTIRGRNLPGGLALDFGQSGFEADKTQLTEDEIVRGVTLTVRCRTAEAGVHEAVLLLKGDGFEHRNPLRVEYVDGIPAYPARDVVCTVNAQRFTASWMDMGEGLDYTLAVYTKDESGQQQMLEGYPKTLTGVLRHTGRPAPPCDLFLSGKSAGRRGRRGDGFQRGGSPYAGGHACVYGRCF